MFEVGQYKWYILVYPQGCDVANHLSLFLCVADYDKLLPGWSHFAQFTIAVVNKDPKKSKYSDTLHRFCKKEHDWGWKKFMELNKVLDGFTVADTLVIRAQVQVIRDRPGRPFRCLDPQYRRELVRVYLTNVEGICRRFLDEMRDQLGMVHKNADSIREFWNQLVRDRRELLSTERADTVLKGLVKKFFSEKEVTSTLVMDALHAGCRMVEEASSAHLSNAVGDPTEAPIVLLDGGQGNFRVGYEDTLSAVTAVLTEQLPPYREDDAGDEYGGRASRDTVDQDEARLVELGRQAVEVYVLAHVWSQNIEVAYREAEALRLQEALLEEEEITKAETEQQQAQKMAAQAEKRKAKKERKKRLKEEERKKEDEERERREAEERERREEEEARRREGEAKRRAEEEERRRAEEEEAARRAEERRRKEEERRAREEAERRAEAERKAEADRQRRAREAEEQRRRDEEEKRARAARTAEELREALGKAQEEVQRQLSRVSKLRADNEALSQAAAGKDRELGQLRGEVARLQAAAARPPTAEAGAQCDLAVEQMLPASSFPDGVPPGMLPPGLRAGGGPGEMNPNAGTFVPFPNGAQSMGFAVAQGGGPPMQMPPGMVAVAAAGAQAGPTVVDAKGGKRGKSHSRNGSSSEPRGARGGQASGSVASAPNGNRGGGAGGSSSGGASAAPAPATATVAAGGRGGKGGRGGRGAATAAAAVAAGRPQPPGRGGPGGSQGQMSSLGQLPPMAQAGASSSAKGSRVAIAAAQGGFAPADSASAPGMGGRRMPPPGMAPQGMYDAQAPAGQAQANKKELPGMAGMDDFQHMGLINDLLDF